MSRRMGSRYPIGARWIAKANHMIGEIWLQERSIVNGSVMEMWRWQSTYDDSSGYRGDWGTSREVVRDECSVSMSAGHDPIRFKRSTTSVQTSPPDEAAAE